MEKDLIVTFKKSKEIGNMTKSQIDSYIADLNDLAKAIAEEVDYVETFGGKNHFSDFS
jgi:3-dehydroquinate dehydratase